LTALLQRAHELCMHAIANGRGDPLAMSEMQTWQNQFEAFMQLLCAHMSAMVDMVKQAQQQQSDTARQYLRSMVPVNLIRGALLHAGDEQREQLRGLLAQLS
jgi:hypothetical protein